MKYQFQVASVNDADRPEYETLKNPAWETILESDSAENLLIQISDLCNDNDDDVDYFSNNWTRILVNGKKVQ
jgi:hypothetical protein